MKVVFNFNPADSPWEKPIRGDQASKYGEKRGIVTDIVIDRLFIGYRPRLEFSDSYYLPIENEMKCLDCNKPIEVSSVRSGGGGLFSASIASLICGCSVWEGEASPFSGSFTITEKFRRLRYLTPKEKADKILKDCDEETKAALKST